ncbi:DNA-directed RNA polymerase II subunit RPB9 [Leucoagaricus sp. SymC.cos]|nr:DNA-directed RNA polymerase II subunit RPB9 [Leucoagaricus sp. SymC.cos]
MVSGPPRFLLFLLNVQTQASLHFCSECNNLLYPKADQQRRVMVYACRICNYDEFGENKCVYRNDLLTVTKEQVGVTTDLGGDPTLAHSNITCPRCGNDDAVFYQDQSKRKETRMILFFVCAKCDHSFADPSLDNRPDTEET